MSRGGGSESFLSVHSMLTLIVPVIALLLAVISGSLLFLNYVHVLSGALWTGIDVFMGVVMSRILKAVPEETRAQIIRKLVPVMLFMMPSLSFVTVTAGILLVMREHLSFSSPLIIAALAIVSILSIQGFAILLPSEIIILRELRKSEPDIARVVRIGMRNVYIAGSQSIFQIAIIFVMAFIVIG